MEVVLTAVAAGDQVVCERHCGWIGFESYALSLCGMVRTEVDIRLWKEFRYLVSSQDLKRS